MTTGLGRLLIALVAVGLFVAVLAIGGWRGAQTETVADPSGAITTTPGTTNGGPELTVATSPPEPVPGWAELAAGTLSSRTGQTAVWTGSELLVWGGFSINGLTDDGGIFALSDGVGSWRDIAAAPITGTRTPATVWTGDELFVFTGAAAMYQPATDLWRQLAYPGVTPSHPLAAAWTGSEIVVIGYEVHPPEASDALFATAYGPRGECCRPLPPPPIHVTYGQAVWTGEHVLLVGGFAPDDIAMLAAYDPVAATWLELEPPPLSGADRLAATWTGDRLVVVDRHLDSAAWTPEDGWRALGRAPIEPAGCFPQTAAADGRVFLWYCRQAAVLDGGTWVPVQVPAMDPHAVSTSCRPEPAGGEILMWCGNGDGAAPFFWRFDPLVVAQAG